MDTVNQIKQVLDIVTVVGSYVNLKKSGKNYKGVCPFHSEDTPSFMVAPDLQIFKCFGCGESGDIFSFVEKIEGIDFVAAMDLLAERAGIKIEKASYDPNSAKKKLIYELNDKATKLYSHLLWNHPSGKTALVYLREKRKLADATIRDFKIGYAPDNFDTLINVFEKNHVQVLMLVDAGLAGTSSRGNFVDKFRHRIMFPLAGIDGKIVGFTGRALGDFEPKYLNSPDTLVYHKSSFIYALDKAKLAIKKQGAIFVEGQMDVISAHEAGITNVVATSGTALTEAQLKLISRYTGDIYFCFDSDTAGLAASLRAIQIAEKLGLNIKIIVVPAPHKDLDELIHADVSLAKRVVTEAIPVYDFVLYSISKRHDTTSPNGKKKVMEELHPWFSTLSNSVLKDHYNKEIASHLNLDVETVSGYFGAPIASQTQFKPQSGPPQKPDVTISLESYIISLLLKGDLDFIKSMGYKLPLEDFLETSNKQLLESLLHFINEGTTMFDPKDFKNRLDPELQTVFDNLYLFELDDTLTEIDALEKEVNSVLARFKRDAAKRRITKITEDLKTAEKTGDTQKVLELTQEIEKLKDSLV